MKHYRSRLSFLALALTSISQAALASGATDVACVTGTIHAERFKGGATIRDARCATSDGSEIECGCGSYDVLGSTSVAVDGSAERSGPFTRIMNNTFVRERMIALNGRRAKLCPTFPSLDINHDGPKYFADGATCRIRLSVNDQGLTYRKERAHGTFEVLEILDEIQSER